MNKTTLLAIVQQGEYDLDQFRAWLKAHGQEPTVIEPETWTLKLKLVNLLSSLCFFLPQTLAIELAVQCLQLLEWPVRQLIYTRASIKLKLLRMQGLKVVAIAGSYAKTSTKQILHHAFSTQIPTLITPKSYNTKLGIARVILSDLKPDHKLLIVEFGEYYAHDIPQLTHFIQPDWGILTPIGRQHLSIIGGFEAVVKTFAQFIAFFKARPTDLLVADQNRSHFSGAQQLFGTQSDSLYQVRETNVTRAGTEFQVFDQSTRQTHQVFIPLFGEHQAINTLSSFWLASKLKIEATEIVKRLRSLPYIHRRHEPTFAENNVLILDNSYNTNAESVKDSLKLINQLQPSHRIIITLGFTELGDESQKIHSEFGQLLAKQVDYVGLIQAPWSQTIIDSFIAAGGKPDHIKVGASQEEALALVQKHIIPDSVVLFEGGYREIYT